MKGVVLNGRDKLLLAYPERTEFLRDLPHDTRLVDAERNGEVHITLYVEAGEHLLKLSYNRYKEGSVEMSMEALKEI